MNKMEVNIEVSARHIHLNKETYDKLFDSELTVLRNLNQLGQFAANETVIVKTDAGCFENVRIVGPLRSYNQVEISMTDARKLKIEPPVRRSGDLTGASKVVVETPKGSVEMDACIIANRHVHVNTKDASKLGINDKDKLKLEIKGDKSGVVDLEAKVSEDGFFEVHLDTDDANAFLINKNKIGILYKE